MIEFDASRRSEDGAVVITMRRGDAVDTVTYTSDDVPLTARPEGAVAGLLLAAMAAGEDVRLTEPLDPTFRSQLDTIQDIYTTWGQGLSRVEVQPGEEEAHSEDETFDSGKGKTAAFFSGGVDSFYTFLKHREEIDALIFVHGFDLDLDDRAMREAVSQRLRDAAGAYGKQLIEVETTLRSVTERKRFTPEFANWELSHGAALASVAHVLSGQFERIYIPATHTYYTVTPWGSHPLLDPLWSLEELSLIYDGCEANRFQKCELIAEHKPALQALRVCWKDTEDGYNCGRCEKCMRTMLMLKAAGALEECTTFRSNLSTRNVAGIWIRKKRTEKYYRLLLEKMAQDHPKMCRAIQRALRYSALKRGARGVLQFVQN